MSVIFLAAIEPASHLMQLGVICWLQVLDTVAASLDPTAATAPAISTLDATLGPRLAAGTTGAPPRFAFVFFKDSLLVPGRRRRPGTTKSTCS